jgi:hypothetical protein
MNQYSIHYEFNNGYYNSIGILAENLEKAKKTFNNRPFANRTKILAIFENKGDGFQCVEIAKGYHVG